MTIREMFQKIEKAGFADVLMVKGGEGLEVIEEGRRFTVIVQKDIGPLHYLSYELDLRTGEQIVEEYKADSPEADMELVCSTYYNSRGEYKPNGRMSYSYERESL